MFAQVDHPGLGLLMDLSNYFESNNIDPMDGILHQVFDTLSDKIKIAHAKDVARAGDDKSEKHADIGDDDALASHTFRGVGEIVLNAAGTGSLNHNLTCNFWRKSIRTFRSLSSIWTKPMCRARRYSWTGNSWPTGFEDRRAALWRAARICRRPTPCRGPERWLCRAGLAA